LESLGESWAENLIADALSWSWGDPQRARLSWMQHRQDESPGLALTPAFRMVALPRD